MVKFLMSFLISFKTFPENATQSYSEPSDWKGDHREKPRYKRFRANPERKNICNIGFAIPTPKESVEKRISIGCWSPMLKVYTKKEDYLFRTEVYNDKTWAAFSIRHKVDEIKPEQFLKLMYTKSLEFYFNEDQRHLQRYRGEQWASYLSPNISKETLFGAVYQVKDKTKLLSKVKSITSTKSVRKKETGSTNKNKPDTPKSKNTEPEVCSKIVPAHLHKIIKAMARSTEDCSTPCSPGPCSMHLPVINLYHEKPVWVLRNDKPMSRNVEDIYVFVTVYAYPDEETRRTLHPLSIYIQSLQYLPFKELEAEGINRIFVEYQLEPVIPITRTRLLHLREDSKNRFNDIKVFFNEKLSPLTIISSFQSKKLFVKVIGVREVLPEAKDVNGFTFYGEEMYDDRFSNCLKLPVRNELLKMHARSKSIPIRTSVRKSSQSRALRFKSKKRVDYEQLLLQNKDLHVLIATARVDLSPLAFGNSSVFAYKELSSLPVLIDDPGIVDLEHLCITEVHKDLCTYEEGAIPNRVLYESNTMIKLTAKSRFLMTPNCVQIHPSINRAFSRMIAILWDKEFSAEILKTIFKHNTESLDMRGFNLPLVPFRKMYKLAPPPPFKSILTFNKEPSCISNEGSTKVRPKKIPIPGPYFTGFCLDCVNKILMYIEGPTISTFPILLTELVKFNVSQGRILYSSDLIYETRIYDSFKPFGGVYCITMKSTIDDFLKKSSSLCHSVSVPEPAWKALNTISKLLCSKNVLEVVQNNYLPRPEQLVSFDVEFGLPHCIVK